MKLRIRFVSNSSSSSFIVLDDDYRLSNIEYFREEFQQYLDEYTNDFNYEPKTEFGWDFVKYSTIREKFDWCCLALYDLKLYNTKLYKKYYKVFYNVIKSIFPEMNEFNYCEDDCEGYIDHQSLEDDDNYIMFKSKSSLKNFLFGESAIYGGNDNEDYYWDGDKVIKNKPIDKF